MNDVPEVTVAESAGRVLASIVCGLFGHVTDSCLSFCLACGKEDSDEA